jgi:hypothetical protein
MMQPVFRLAYASPYRCLRYAPPKKIAVLKPLANLDPRQVRFSVWLVTGAANRTLV